MFLLRSFILLVLFSLCIWIAGAREGEKPSAVDHASYVWIWCKSAPRTLSIHNQQLFSSSSFDRIEFFTIENNSRNRRRWTALIHHYMCMTKPVNLLICIHFLVETFFKPLDQWTSVCLCVCVNRDRQSRTHNVTDRIGSESSRFYIKWIQKNTIRFYIIKLPIS